MTDDLILALGYRHDYEADDSIFDRLADLIDPVCDGWHTEPPEDERFVLCQGERGGFFVGRYQAHGGMEFYVPNYRGGYRTAVAWHELPEPYGGDANGDE